MEFFFSDIRNKEPAYQFLIPSSLRDTASFHPNALNTDKNSLYGNAITRFNREGRLQQDIEHR